MANALFKEVLDGKYDGVTAPNLMAPGSLSGGLNVRKVSPKGGWKPRKGCTLHNTTAVGDQIDSLHAFVVPKQEEQALIVQTGGALLKATNYPPASGTTLGTSLGVTVSTSQKGFGDLVENYWFYADGSGAPIAYGGSNPFPKAVLNYDASEAQYVEGSRLVADSRTDTEMILIAALTDKLYVISQQRLSGIKVVLGSTVNAVAATLAVKALRSGAFTSVSGLSDGTADGGATLAQSGTISWTASTADTQGLIGGEFGYIYQLGWDAALTSSVTIVSMSVVEVPAELANKWHGVFEYLSGCRFYDQSAGEYQEALGKVSSDSTSTYLDLDEATTSDYLYLKTPEPACAFGLAPSLGYLNSAASLIDGLEVLEGDSWTSITGYTDTTKDTAGDSSLAQLGILSFDPSTYKPTRRTFAGDSYPGYWYRISWSAALSASTRVYQIVYASAPEALPPYDGCVEFKGRLVVWGDPEFPNQLRISQFEKPFSFTGVDSGYSDAMGYNDPVLVAKRFYNELIIWKKSSIWLLEGYNMANFGTMRLTSILGIASPQTAQVVETGYPGMHTQEPLMIAIWQAIDGVYVLDGRKPKKVSGPIDQYFNPEYDTCIAAADITSLDSFVDHVNNTYHLLLPTAIDGVTELVYNYITDEWYPPWQRALRLSCGTVLRGWNTTLGGEERFYVYGGTSEGLVLRLEYDTSDKNSAGADVAIEHSIKTRAISYEQKSGISLKFTLRRLVLEAKAQDVGAPTTTLYLDQKIEGTKKDTPATMSLVRSGYRLAYPWLDLSESQVVCFEAEWTTNVVDHETEIYSFLYELEGQGIPNL